MRKKIGERLWRLYYEELDKSVARDRAEQLAKQRPEKEEEERKELVGCLLLLVLLPVFFAVMFGALFLAQSLIGQPIGELLPEWAWGTSESERKACELVSSQSGPVAWLECVTGADVPLFGR